MLNRYFIHLGYKGTHYHGWQIQPNAITVQEVIDKALSVILKERIETTGCGRTDTGVHAPCFYAHFESAKIDLHTSSIFMHQLNCLLPLDIAVYHVYSVPTNAHARFDAISRTYLYRITQQKDPFVQEFAAYLAKPLQLDSMNQACELMKGFTDFTSFSKLHTDVKTNNCKVFFACWINQQHEIHFTITADRFLRNMVRAIVGSLLDVGSGKTSVNDFLDIIEKKNRSSAGISVPAKGLHLVDIKYPEAYNLGQS